MKKLALLITVLILTAGGFYAVYTFGVKKQSENLNIQQTDTNDNEMVGADRDEYGCVGSAGYTWCQVKQKCLRSWEEACDDKGDESVNEEVIIEAIREALIAKHGSDAAKLNVTVSKISGDYSQGGASGEGGGGMWFAAKVNGLWKLVWDGNGIIKCSDLKDYSDFPTNMIPECYDDSTDTLVKR